MLLLLFAITAIESTDITQENVIPINSNGSCIDANGNKLNNQECIAYRSNNDNDTDKEPIDYDSMDFSLDPSNYNYPYDCPGLQAGFECDYESPWSSRDGDHYFCDIETVHINDMTYAIIYY